MESITLLVTYANGDKVRFEREKEEAYEFLRNLYDRGFEGLWRWRTKDKYIWRLINFKHVRSIEIEEYNDDTMES